MSAAFIHTVRPLPATATILLLLERLSGSVRGCCRQCEGHFAVLHSVDISLCVCPCLLCVSACAFAAVFSRSRYQSHPCHVARHPLLVSYIAAAVDGARAAVTAASALRLVVVLFDSQQKRCRERFVFDCRSPQPPLTAQPQPEPASLDALQTELSHCLLHLTACNALLASVPADGRCSFTLLLYSQQRPVQRPQQQQHNDGSEPHWLPIDVSAPSFSTHSSAAQLPLLVPLRSVHTSLLDVELYVEERADDKAAVTPDNRSTDRQHGHSEYAL